MTITTTHTLTCQGLAGHCPASMSTSTGTPNTLRTAARRAGWSTVGRAGGGRDTCPDCTAAPPPGTCHACRDHHPVEFRDGLRHDPVGHRLANLLASEDVTTVADLLDLSAPRLRKMRGLGTTGAARIAWAQNHYRSQTCPS